MQAHCHSPPHGAPSFALHSLWLVLPGSCHADLPLHAATAHAAAGCQAAAGTAATAPQAGTPSHAALGTAAAGGVSRGGEGGSFRVLEGLEAVRWGVVGATCAEPGELLLLATGATHTEALCLSLALATSRLS